MVAGCVAKAVKVKAEKGLLKVEGFPLLMHIGEIITHKNLWTFLGKALFLKRNDFWKNSRTRK